MGDGVGEGWGGGGGGMGAPTYVNTASVGNDRPRPKNAAAIRHKINAKINGKGSNWTKSQN